MLCSFFGITFTWMATLFALSTAAAELQTKGTASFVRSENDCRQKTMPIPDINMIGYRKAFRVSGYYVCMKGVVPASAKEKGEVKREEKDPDDQAFEDDDAAKTPAQTTKPREEDKREDFEDSESEDSEKGGGGGIDDWKRKVFGLAGKLTKIAKEKIDQKKVEHKETINRVKEAGQQVHDLVKSTFSRLFGK